MFYQFNHFGFSEYFTKEYGENFSFPVHLHNAFEFVTVFDGEMKITIDGKEYILTKGESVLIFPNQLHLFESKNSRHMLCIFSPELVKAYHQKIKKSRPLNSKFTLDTYLISAIDALKDSSTTFEKKGALYSMCAFFDKKTSYAPYQPTDKDLLHNIFSFVEENFNKECSLKELETNTGYSYSYLSRSFKKVTGMSFNLYVNQYRIRNACYLLSNTDLTVLQCALDSGYTSLRSFNRNFSELLSITPKQYREKIKM